LPGDLCPPGQPAIPAGCTTPKISLHGQDFASGDPAGPTSADFVAPGLGEDAELAAVATHVDPNAGGVVTVYMATVEAVLHDDTNTNTKCIVRKHIRVWRSQSTPEGAQQGDWTEIQVPDQLSLPGLPGVTEHWISDPALAVDADGFVYLAAVRVDTEQDCTTNNANDDAPPQRILLYAAAKDASSFTNPIEVSTSGGLGEMSGVDHPKIAANPVAKGQVVVTYWHDAVDGGSDRLVTLQRVPASDPPTFEQNAQGDSWLTRCFITESSCQPADTTFNGNFESGPSVAFSDAGDLYLAFSTGGTTISNVTHTDGEVLQRLEFNATTHAWETKAQVTLPALSGFSLIQRSEVDFHTMVGNSIVSLAADWTPGLAVANVGANADPIVYMTFDLQPSAAGATSFGDDRQIFIGAVDGKSNLSLDKWHVASTLPHGFHSSVAMSGPGDVSDIVFFEIPPTDLPSTSITTHVQTVVQRLDASRLTPVGDALALPSPPELQDLPSRHGESTDFTPGSLFVGEYLGVTSLGLGFAVGRPGLHLASDGTDTVQALLNLGSQKCDPPSAIAINRPDSYWQCDNCDCGSDGAHDAVGCVPGTVSDPAVICSTLCGGTLCGRSLSCAHATCTKPSAPTATLLAVNSCNTHDGERLGSEPSLFADYVAGDDGTSLVTLAKASHVFSTGAPGTVAFNLSESPSASQREIEIARIDLTPDNFTTAGFKIGPITIEPPHQIHDLRLVHGERLYGVFSDATHFQIPAGAADFFAVGYDGASASQQFESNTSPINGAFDPVAGTFSLDLIIGDPTTDGAEATFHGTLTRKPSYDCAAGIAPVFAPLNTITVEPCYEGAPVAVPLPRVADRCTPHSILISGEIIAINGSPVSPIAMPNDLVSITSGQIEILWTATDANGTTSQAQQTIVVQARPALYALGSLDIDANAQILTSKAAGTTIMNGGPAGETSLHNGSRSGGILSVPDVRLTGATVDGAIRSSGAIQNINGTVSGQMLSHTPVVLPPFPSVASNFPTGPDVTVAAAETLAPGSYGALFVASGASVSIRSGAYTFTSIHIDGSVKLDTTQGPVSVNVQSAVFYDGAITSDSSPDRFVLGYVGNKDVEINSAFDGVIIAPHATLKLGVAKQAHTGAFYAASIKVFEGATVTQAPFACTLP
jgi:hypothetical protein